MVNVKLKMPLVLLIMALAACGLNMQQQLVYLTTVHVYIWTQRDSAQFVENVRDENFSQGAISDAAQFISNLRSNRKVRLSVSQKVVDSGKDLFKACVSTVITQALAVLSEHNVNSEKSRRLVDTISWFENPFVGLYI
jgi:hypothetical protein